MYLLRHGIKDDPVRRWNLADRVFFACGACHILAYAFLERFPSAGFSPIWIRPRSEFTGNHVFVTDGDLTFDYHGYVPYVRLVGHYTKRAQRLFPEWEADLVCVTVSLVEMVGILMAQRAWTSPSPPAVCLDFWTSAYLAIDD